MTFFTEALNLQLLSLHNANVCEGAESLTGNKNKLLTVFKHLHVLGNNNKVGHNVKK